MKLLRFIILVTVGVVCSSIVFAQTNNVTVTNDTCCRVNGATPSPTPVASINAYVFVGTGDEYWGFVAPNETKSVPEGTFKGSTPNQPAVFLGPTPEKSNTANINAPTKSFIIEETDGGWGSCTDKSPCLGLYTSNPCKFSCKP